MKNKHKLYIGERIAEEMKMTIGTAFHDEEKIVKECKGRDLVTGLPKSVEISWTSLPAETRNGTGRFRPVGIRRFFHWCSG